MSVTLALIQKFKKGNIQGSEAEDGSDCKFLGGWHMKLRNFVEWGSKDDKVGDCLRNAISHEVSFHVNASAFARRVCVLLPEEIVWVTLNQIYNHDANKPSEYEKCAEVEDVFEARDGENSMIEHNHRHFDGRDGAAVDKFQREDKLRDNH